MNRTKYNHRWSRRSFCFKLLPAFALSLSACQGDGHFSILGYTTKPNYDCNIHTVRVPVFKNLTYRRGVEFELTKAVGRQIELKTPYKVVGEWADADTELIGTIKSYNKGLLNRNQLNEVREAETPLVVEIVWRDLRTGEILSAPKRGNGTEPPPPPLPGAPVPKVDVQSIAGFIPELGESPATAQKKNVDRLAIQIVSMMEKPW